MSFYSSLKVKLAERISFKRELSLLDYCKNKFNFSTSSDNISKSIYLLLPSVIKGKLAGGNATALAFAAYLFKTLRNCGYNKIVFISLDGGLCSVDTLSRHFKKMSIDISLSEISSLPFTDSTKLDQNSIFIATFWSTAYCLQLSIDHFKSISGRDLSPQFIYLIQDYEPLFVNSSSTAEFIKSTYSWHGNHLCIVNSKQLYDYFILNNICCNLSGNIYYFDPQILIQ